MEKIINNLYIFPLLVSAILSLKSFRQGWPDNFKIFSILLWVMFVVESFAILWKYELHKSIFGSFSRNNYWFYNLMLIPQFVLYHAFFYNTVNTRKAKKNIIVYSTIFIVFALINLLYIQKLFALNTLTVVLAFLIGVSASIEYFQNVNNQSITTNLRKEPLIYIFLGIFISQSANIPYLLAIPYLSTNNLLLAKAFFYVFIGINSLMFILFSIAYTCKPQPN